MSEANGASSSPIGTPSVILGYRFYCAIMALLYFVLVVLGAILVAIDGSSLAELDMEPLEGIITGIGLIVISAPLMVGFGAGPFLPRKKWSWTAGMILICIGLSSACCMPVCLPLLLYWLKDDTKVYFNAM